MKKLRFIPLLAVIALTSCNSMKAPSFENEGEEVKFDVYTQKLAEAQLANEVFDDSGILGDRSTKYSFSTYIVSSVRRNKSEISKTELTTIVTDDCQYDSDNFVAKEVYTEKVITKGKDQEGAESRESNSKTEYYYQFGKIGYVEYLLNINNTTKEYTKMNTAYSKEKSFDQLIREDFTNSLSKYGSYAPVTADDYTFYMKDDMVFTFLTTTEEEVELRTNILGKDTVYAIETTRKKIKGQINLTDKKEAVKISNEVTIETVYQADYEKYVEGDVKTNEVRLYIDFTSASRNININEIDIVDYHLMAN